MEGAATRTVGKPGGQNRTSDILLLVVGFVVAGLAAAWFLAGKLADEGSTGLETPAMSSAAPAADPGLAISASAGEGAEANLAKARMAASAGMLVEPAGQNALYFYSLVLDAEPEHARAAGELAAIADEVADGVRDHLDASEFGEAARLASKLAGVTPGHPVIVEVQETLIAEQQRLVMEAVGAARNGRDGTAAARLAAAESLPQVDGALIETAREQIGEIRAERAAAAREAERRRQAAAERARQQAAARKAAEAASAEASEPPASQEPEPLDLARESLAAGRLIGPADNNALLWLTRAEAEPSDEAGLAEFRERLVTAMSVALRDGIDAGDLEEAEALLEKLGDVAGSDTEVGALQEEVDRAFIRRESRKVLSGSEMLATEVTPPVYPRAAIRRGQEGWVDVEFTVLASGRTADAEVTAASPERVFDRSSLRAVEQWQFKPRIYRGRPIDQRVTTRITYTLQDD